MRSRADVVRDLVRLAKPLRQIRAELSTHTWDVDAPLVTVEAVDVIRILNHFLDGSLAPEEVEEWANAIELRDDVSFDDEASEEAIFDLANPVLQGALTSDFALRMKQRLEATRKT